MGLLSAEQYIKSFEQILSNELLSCEDIKPQIQYLISNTPLSYQQINFAFIVRTSVLESDEVCNNISRCTYNPDYTRIPLQRCNYAKQQVFYGSVPGGMKNLGDAAQSSFMETCFDRIKEDMNFSQRFVVTSRWAFKKVPFVWVLPYYSGSVELNENFKFLFNQFDSVLKQRSDDSEYGDLKKKAEYLSSLYCSNKNKKSVYRVTSTFHNEVCRVFNSSQEDKLDGVIYPSANTKGEGMNIALNKDFIIPENIACDIAVLYKFERNKNDHQKISFLPIAQAAPDANGELIFYPLHAK